MKKISAILVSFLLFIAYSCTKSQENDVYSNGEKIKKITYYRTLCATANCEGLNLIVYPDSLIIMKNKNMVDSFGNPIFGVCSRAITQEEWLSILPNILDPFYEQAATYEPIFCGTGIDFFGLSVNSTLRDGIFAWETNSVGASKNISKSIEDTFADDIEDCH
jgi:hypothetical protein